MKCSRQIEQFDGDKRAAGILNRLLVSSANRWCAIRHVEM
jgi:hypothetical protein